jgi:hypothetical protein
MEFEITDSPDMRSGDRKAPDVCMINYLRQVAWHLNPAERTLDGDLAQGDIAHAKDRVSVEQQFHVSRVSVTRARDEAPIQVSPDLT